MTGQLTSTGERVVELLAEANVARRLAGDLDRHGGGLTAEAARLLRAKADGCEEQARDLIEQVRARGRDARKCAICGYRFPDEYEPGAVVCGACLDTYPEQAAQLGDPLAMKEEVS